MALYLKKAKSLWKQMLKDFVWNQTKKLRVSDVHGYSS